MYLKTATNTTLQRSAVFLTYAIVVCCTTDKFDMLLQPWLRRNRCCNRKNQNKVERLSVYAISLYLHGS